MKTLLCDTDVIAATYVEFHRNELQNDVSIEFNSIDSICHSF
jgi:hypothetical protein